MNDLIDLIRHFSLYYNLLKVHHVMILSDIKHIIHSIVTEKNNFPQIDSATNIVLQRLS